ncbi:MULTISPECIES: adenylate/guanylate cyclase domain-containing protein [unclassified Ruegeria]|uniref:adenylate/guanylate cyclase domain-containing protein n=1 Tax=unclassified Ruegeria TaxID=2625375 RepID=UPI0014899B18|nr:MULTISPECIES: adenylate/guanylate cyclase domain-containing protein [unclassified Ruegeria]
MQELTPLRSEELASQRAAAIGRSIALFFIAVLVTFLSPWPAPIFTVALLLIFALLGWAPWLVASSSWGKPWHQYAFVFADFSLLTFTLLFPNPLVPFDYPPQFAFRFGPFIYFFVLLSGLAYVYQPRLVLWGGVCGSLTWAIGVGFLFNLPDTVSPEINNANLEDALSMAAQPTFIDIDVRIQEIVVFLIASGLLALAVKRSRNIAVRQASLAREKENLGRYFPKKTAQFLAERSDPFWRPKEHSAAVLFADLVAFTTWSEEREPVETIGILREVHGILANIVFRHNGTLDKFIGDGLMATFGTPEPTDSDASNALQAMIEMVNEFERWKKTKSKLEGGDLKLAIGAHYGPVVIGNIGTRQRLEFAVLGDTVNVASRLESATRNVGCCGLASSELVEVARKETKGEESGFIDNLIEQGRIKLRGRKEEIDVFGL